MASGRCSNAFLRLFNFQISKPTSVETPHQTADTGSSIIPGWTYWKEVPEGTKPSPDLNPDGPRHRRVIRCVDRGNHPVPRMRARPHERAKLDDDAKLVRCGSPFGKSDKTEHRLPDRFRGGQANAILDTFRPQHRHAGEDLELRIIEYRQTWKLFRTLNPILQCSTKTASGRSPTDGFIKCVIVHVVQLFEPAYRLGKVERIVLTCQQRDNRRVQQFGGIHDLDDLERPNINSANMAENASFLS